MSDQERTRQAVQLIAKALPSPRHVYWIEEVAEAFVYDGWVPLTDADIGHAIYVSGIEATPHQMQAAITAAFSEEQA